MIVAIASSQGQSFKSLLVANLAVLRARSGHKICMIDADPQRSAYRWSCERKATGQGPLVPARTLTERSLSREIEDLSTGYSDLLINTGERDTHETRSALTVARVVLVPVRVGEVSLAAQYALIARLNAARMFNPSLKVLFVLVSERPSHSPSNEELAAVRLYVSHVMSAKLATTILHAPCADEYGLGRCICDAETCDSNAAAELNALYREVFM